PVAASVATAGGQTFGYDSLVVSPGIDFRWDAIEGYDRAAAKLMPHAWRAGDQLLLLKQQVEAMPAGGVVVIAPPVQPFRAPPAPYERASMLAYYLKDANPTAKILIVDSRPEIEEHAQLQQAWDELYPGMIEWISGDGQLRGVDVAGMTVVSASGARHTGNVVNVIPPQQAGAIAFSSDLVDGSGWCPVDPRSFESIRQVGVHVIGDACIAGEMPKAASAANTQAKACAAAIVAKISGEPAPDPFLMSVFYGLLGRKSAISNVGVYRVIDGEIRKVSGGVTAADASSKTRRKEMKYAGGWFKAITTEAFG
ncbi:MAG: FCSD flavin-binding domain-containing protein, partial [Gammaproteobacteria bacterium]